MDSTCIFLLCLKMAEKRLQQPWFKEEGEDKPEDSPVEVGGVVDVIAALACHVLAIGEVEETEEDAGDGNHCEQQDLVPGVEEYRGEKDSGNRSRSPDGGIPRRLPVTDDIRNGCRRHTPEIEKQESPFAKTQIAESCLNVLSERPKCKHVHQQVHPVSMYESVRQDAPPLSLLYHPLRFQCQSFKQVLPVETGQRYAECSCNNQVGEHIT